MERPFFKSRTGLAWVAIGLAIAARGCTVRQEMSARLQAGIPEWTQGNTAVRAGNDLQVVCSGQGPSIDQARAWALRSCKSSALDFLRSDVAVRGVTVESETGVAMHQEIEERAYYKGLACKPLRDEVRALDGGLFEVWLKCGFDLTKVEKTQTPDEASDEAGNGAGQTADNDANRSQLVRQRELRIDSNQASMPARSNYVVDIVSIPPCESLVIRGRKSRPVRCSGDGVTSVAVEAGDQEIIVRAAGFMSKTVKIIPGVQRHETVQVVLDPAN